jgi:hypothetical protein
VSFQHSNSFVAFWCASVLLALAALAGCADWSVAGPVGTPNFEPAIRVAVLKPNEQLRYASASDWMANVTDFNDLFNHAPDIAENQGALILTDERLIFAQYDPKSKSYSARLSVRYQEILSAHVTSRSMLRALALEFDDHSSHLFTVGRRPTQTAETEKALQIIEQSMSQARANADAVKD